MARKRTFGAWVAEEWPHVSVVSAFAATLATLGFFTWPSSDPGLEGGVLGAIFDNAWVVGVTRLGLFALVLYLVASVTARVWQGAWLRAAGPFSTDTAISVNRKIRDLEAELVKSRNTIDDLRKRVDTQPSDVPAEG